jgi:succinate dehydrogenase / fumarate reductase flavoprotein subunit
MEDYWKTDHLVEYRCQGHFMQEVRQVSSYLLVLISHFQDKFRLGTVQMYNRHEMLDLVKVDGKARGIIARNLITGEIQRHAAHAVVLATGGYGNVFYLSTNAMMCNVTAAWKSVKKGA